MKQNKINQQQIAIEIHVYLHIVKEEAMNLNENEEGHM